MPKEDIYRRRKVLNIWGGEGRGQGSEYWGIGGPRGGGKLFAGCKVDGAPAAISVHQCQIITFLILKTDNIAKLRIELKSILLDIPSNK